MRQVLIPIAILLIALGCSRAPQQEARGSAPRQAIADTYGAQLGTVRLTPSCGDEAAERVRRGLALLHHMTYEGARVQFERASDEDPGCAMAYWGRAMTLIHPLWSDPPGENAFHQGEALLMEARTRGRRTPVEEAMVAAAEGYFSPGWSRSERPNLMGFAMGWQEANRRFPDDPEITAFHALAHLATADPADKTYRVQLEAGALAEKVLAEVPDHPGGEHYLIHAYDVPPLAAKALDVARQYGKIAPEVPHALHMPTHIFTRLGLWEDSIEGNRRAAAAALKHPYGDATSPHYYHALDYLAYAYLQRAQDQEARDVVASLRALHGPIHVTLSTAYALAAIPARVALETRDWAAAADLEPRTPDSFPWDQFPAMEAITYFARGIGAARSGRISEAEAAHEALTTLRDLAAQSDAYWAQQVEIQRLAVEAWTHLANDQVEAALAVMKASSDLEASTEKHPVTPGAILPAQELLGDMLMETGKPGEALVAYEAALARSPNRFNGLYGAAHAAELAGDQERAALHYAHLIENTISGDTERSRLRAARAFMAKNPS